MSLQTLPLSSLILSNLNVRHTERDADIASLAEDIAARGLKQNLVVIPAHMKSAAEWPRVTPEGGVFEVIAGGRRFQAMRLLVADGRLPAEHPVPVLVEERETATETSLSENLHKVAMNPADEFAAFSKVVADCLERGESQAEAVAWTAKRFGVTVRHVEGRMRLASLCPEVLDALRANVITLDIAKAYAGVSDHEAQRAVFRAVAKTPYTLTAKEIRSRLRGVTCPLDDHRMEFVGIEAYRAAGGRTEVEMFMGADGQERVLDVVLLDRLAETKGTQLAEAAAKAAGWKGGLFTTGNAYMLKKPEGMSLTYHSADQVSKTKRKKCIAIYTNRGEAVELEAFFEPRQPAAPVEHVDWEAERAKEWRERQIQLTAARMAIGPLSSGCLKGTPLEGRTFWPKYHAPAIEPDRDDPDFAYIALLIRVPVTEIEAHHEAAAKAVDEAAAADAAREAKAESEIYTDEDDGADELTTDEAEG